MDPGWVDAQTFPNDLKNLLKDLRKQIDDYKPVKWLYASNNAKHGNSDDDLVRTIKEQNYETLYPAVELEILAVEEMARLYLETKKVEASVPSQIKFSYPVDKGIFDSTGHPYFVGLIKANVVIDWYKTHQESLFNENIRTLLTKNRINSEMAETIEGSPNDFRHFNNGISAICEKLTVDVSKREIVATKFNVINGAQTLGTLHDKRHAAKIDDVEVLVRITEVGYASALSGNITRYNNTQNVVAAPDFKSNDPIQLWLEQEFKKYRYPGNFQKIVYRRKRPYQRGKSNETMLNIVDFAKIRRAYKKSSAEQNSKPNDIWKLKSEGGCYEDIFPTSGSLDPDSFVYFNFVFSIYTKLVEKLDVEKKAGGERRKALTRMALLGVEAFDHFWRENKTGFPKYDEIANGKLNSDVVFNNFWYSFYTALEKIYDREINDGNTTPYTFVRSAKLTEEVIKDTLSLYKMARSIKI